MSKMSLNVGIRGLKRGTSVFDIKVPEKMRIRHKCNVSWIDGAFGKHGFVPSTAIMVTGTPGAGKTTFLMQLADALTGAGHIALYNTGEESLYQIKMVAERLDLKNGFVVGQDEKTADIIEHAEELRKANPKKQVFLLHDSLQTLDDGYYENGHTNGNTQVRAIEQLTNWAKEKYGIFFFIGQVTKDGTFAGKNAIKHCIDAHAQLYFDDGKKSETYGERLFEVTKNRYGVSGMTYIVGLNKKGLYEKGHFSLTGLDEE
jgi:DNA repair protein RadA/Sms